jgi:hypothetical protein
VSIFEKPLIEEMTPKYPQFKLWSNPFAIREEMAREDEPHSELMEFIYNREVSRLRQVILSQSKAGHRSLWIIKDPGVARYQVDTVTAGLFRALLNLENPRIFPVLSLLTLVYRDFLPLTLKIFLDRFQQKNFRLCFYSYIYHELKALVERKEEKTHLPDFDVQELLLRLEETEGEILDEILYPPPPEEETDSESVKSKAELEGEGEFEETSDTEQGVEEVEQVTESSELQELEEQELEGEEAEEQQAEEQQASQLSKEFLLQVKRRNQLVSFLELQLQKSPFGPLVKESFRRAFLSLETGYKFLQAGGEAREVLLDMIKLLSQYYSGLVTFVDQMDGWYMLSEDEKRRLISAISEWSWLTEGFGCLVLLSRPDILKELPADFINPIPKVEMKVQRPSFFGEKISVEEGKSIMVEFLASQRVADTEIKSRGETETELFPFTAEAVEGLVDLVDGDTVQFLRQAGELLDQALRESKECIDISFVKEACSGRL